jgi:hypothetical protein
MGRHVPGSARELDMSRSRLFSVADFEKVGERMSAIPGFRPSAGELNTFTYSLVEFLFRYFSFFLLIFSSLLFPSLLFNHPSFGLVQITCMLGIIKSIPPSQASRSPDKLSTSAPSELNSNKL